MIFGHILKYKINKRRNNIFSIDSVLSMEIPSTGPQSLRSEFGEEKEGIAHNGATVPIEAAES